MNDDRQKEELMARTDLAELCRELGLDPNRTGRLARCPAHQDQGHPNLAIYKAEPHKNTPHVHCFACNFHADAIGLVRRVKGCGFVDAYNFLADRIGYPHVESGRLAKSRGGRSKGTRLAKLAPSPRAVPLPATPSLTLTARRDDAWEQQGAEEPQVLHGEMFEVVEGFQIVPDFPGLWHDEHDPHPRPPLPCNLWRRDFTTLAAALAYARSLWGEYRCAAGRAGGGRYAVCGYLWRSNVPVAAPAVPARGQSLRVKVFAALLELTTLASRTQAGEWLYREKGISPATQDRFGLGWLDDPQGAEKELRRLFGDEALLDYGILGEREDKQTKAKHLYFAFYRHRLLFPFFWRNEPVDVQGRDIHAQGKQDRFRNTRGKNTIPFNADALLKARATGKELAVCEGVTDTLSIEQCGRLAIGIVGTGGFKAEWLPYFAGLAVYLAFDNDEAGRKAARDVSQIFVAAGHPAPRVVRLPEGVKDMNEFLRGQAVC